MRKRDALLILENPVRSNIIMRLDEAEKAAYSDLLDSAGIIEVLDSRGNFNYHLNFLLKNSIVVKEGAVYRLTDRGRAIAQFIKEVNRVWKQTKPRLGGGYMDKVGYAEDFGKEIGLRMHRAIDERTLKGRVEMVMDEKLVLGILDEESCEDEYFQDYEEITLEDLTLFREETKWNNEEHISYVLGHPDLTYRLSPHYFGAVLLYLQRNFNEARLYADKKKPMPLILRAKKLQVRYEGPAFAIAPVVLGPYKKK